jgi:UTP--glucose-1-phosphate uridylyltransferase
MKITKAIFPVAGLGTRFLPATKATPKEMLPIIDKPLIQYAVEEAIAAGITELIFVTSSTKRAIEDHFDRNWELEHRLAENGKQELLKLVCEILPNDVSCIYVRQSEQLGLGHAVLCAQHLIKDEPFAVLLADDLVSEDCLTNMVQKYNSEKSSIVAVQPISAHETERYGVVGLTSDDINQPLLSIIEKPNAKAAPSNLGVVGRYILTPAIFAYLAEVKRGVGGEIQLTDAIAALMKTEKVYAYELEQARYDCGSKLGYLEATVHYALRHPELGSDFANFLKKLKV